MSRMTDLAVRKLELKCRRSGKRVFSFVALMIALGFCVLAATKIQKYGTDTIKNNSKAQGNGLQAVFAAFSGTAIRPVVVRSFSSA